MMGLARMERAKAHVDQSSNLVPTASAQRVATKTPFGLDFGTVALHDSAAHLLREEIEAVGVETPTREACDPSFFSLSDGKRIALLAISDVDPMPNSQIAAASVRAKLGPAITKARSHANLVICLVHGGIENSEKITDEQRELARWLIDRGVDLVVGSHPHCV
jgi:poly-gamma-glutamate synthesis protein (capsule biosynthesis protein)